MIIDLSDATSVHIFCFNHILNMAILLELLKDGLSGKTVVELGSGTGAVGLAAAALGLIFVIFSFFCS